MSQKKKSVLETTNRFLKLLSVRDRSALNFVILFRSKIEFLMRDFRLFDSETMVDLQIKFCLWATTLNFKSPKFRFFLFANFKSKTQGNDQLGPIRRKFWVSFAVADKLIVETCWTSFDLMSRPSPAGPSSQWTKSFLTKFVIADNSPVPEWF